MLQAGIGTQVDLQSAADWYEIAAKQGQLESQVNLGLLYVGGESFLQDFERAHMWFNIAAANGHEGAKDFRDRLSIKLTNQTIASAQKKARICLESNFLKCN
jgi:TPR repeat protein